MNEATRIKRAQIIEQIESKRAEIRELEHELTLPGMGDPFEFFWSAYPVKRGRALAIRVWDAIGFNLQLFCGVLAALDEAKNSKDWQIEGGRFIPYAHTWLAGWACTLDDPDLEKRIKTVMEW